MVSSNVERFRVMRNDGRSRRFRNLSARRHKSYREASHMEKEGQPCEGHDHAVREGRPCHQGRPRQTRKRILGHVCVRVQPNRLRIDYAMVQATDQATLLRWRHLRTCYRLPGSYPLPRECRIRDSWLHCSCNPSIHSTFRSWGSTFLEPACRRHKNRQKIHHSLICHKWHTRRETTTHRGRQDRCAETRVSIDYS